MAERRAGGSGHLDGFRRRRGEVLRPDPGALLASRGPDDGVHTHCAPRHQACQRWRPVKGADSRSRARGRTKGESTARPRSYASARQRYTRGPRTPGVASRQTFRTGGSVHGTTRARLRGAPRDQPLAYASGARADTSCRPTSRLSTRRQRPRSVRRATRGSAWSGCGRCCARSQSTRGPTISRAISSGASRNCPKNSSAPKGGGARGGPAVVIRPEGAAQIALIGPPNAGKSSLHARLQHPPATCLAGLPAAGAGSPSPRHLDQRNSTLAGCDVDSHSAWYKTSVRSSQSLLMTLSRRVRQAEENTERREAHWLGYEARAAPHVRTGARKAVDVWLGT